MKEPSTEEKKIGREAGREGRKEQGKSPFDKSQLDEGMT